MLDLTGVDIESVATMALAIIRDTEGLSSNQERPLQRLMAAPSLQPFVTEVERGYENAQHLGMVEVIELLYTAFVAGWACRGAVECVLRDEIPVPLEID